MEFAQALAYLALACMCLPLFSAGWKSKFDCDGDGLEIIAGKSFCNGILNCSSGNDEVYLSSIGESNKSGIPCRRNRYICLLPTRYAQNHTLFCRKDVNCSEDEFKCLDQSECLPITSFCNGKTECKDGSDELPLGSSERGIPCRRDKYKCKLPEHETKKKNTFCRKSLNCSHDEFECEDQSACLPKNWFCNGHRECKNGSDEISVNSGRPGKPCRRLTWICLLPISQHHKEGVFCIENASCTDKEFQCADKTGCLPIDWFCDGREDCRDGSDDQRLSWKLTNGSHICNGRHQFSKDPLKCEAPLNFTCPKEPFCLKDPKDFMDDKCFKCLRNPYILIPIANLCNGIIDCPDLSDECMCKTKNRSKICEGVVWVHTGNEDHLPTWPGLKCQAGNGSSVIIRKGICNKRIDCANETDEVYCNKDIYDRIEEVMITTNYTCQFDQMFPKKATRCDNMTKCDYDVHNEECECPDPPGFCNFTVTTKEGSFLFCNTTIDWNKLHRAGFVHGKYICDGVPHCEDKKDELYCSNRTHFYCKQGSPKFIPIQKACDQVVNCEDESDEEAHCSFKCPSNNTPAHYIGNNEVCDGEEDCEGGYDECLPRCIISSFSNNSTMIKNTPALVCLFLISTFSLCGNSLLILVTIRHFFCFKNKNFVRDNLNPQRHKILINRILILNLAISGLLVGIYTLSICIKDLLTIGEYCLADRAWRSGTTCSVLGVLLVIGSQQSVFTMILLTVSRLIGIHRPFGHMPLKRLFIGVAFAWFVAIALALIPLLPRYEDTFTTAIWYKENELLTTVKQNDIFNMTMWLLTPTNSAVKLPGRIGSWKTLETLISTLNSSLTAGRKYGFYSTHTVCIPDLFPDRANNASWWYSLLIILINFVAFVFILFGCILIYRHVTKDKIARSAAQQADISSRMQRKLTAIVIVDFLCWIPVCIMAFLQLSGISIPQDWRLVVGLVIIPINSALNPIIYSDLPVIIWSKTKRPRTWIYSHLEPCITAFASAVGGGNTDDGDGTQTNSDKLAILHLPEIIRETGSTVPPKQSEEPHVSSTAYPKLGQADTAV